MAAKNHLPPISLTVSTLTSKNHPGDPPGTTLKTSPDARFTFSILALLVEVTFQMSGLSLHLHVWTLCQNFERRPGYKNIDQNHENVKDSCFWASCINIAGILIR